VRLAKLAHLVASKSKPVTLKPLRSKLRAKFSPMTPRPMSPMWVDFIDICQFQIYQDFRMGWGVGGIASWKGHEVIGIGGKQLGSEHN
jgi:hypothetical protein